MTENAMPMIRQQIDRFFAAIEPFKEAYQNVHFSYLAFKTANTFTIIQGRVILNTGEAQENFEHFQSQNLRAGRYRLSELHHDVPTLIECLLSGSLSTPHGELKFESNPMSGYQATYDPLHPDGVKLQSRFNVLRILGKHHERWNRDPLLDWELKGHSTPYDSIQELAFDYQLGQLGEVSSLEIAALNVAVLDFSQSSVSDTKARITSRLASVLSLEKFTLGYQVFSLGRVIARSSLRGDAMMWTSGLFREGVAEIEVPQAAVLHCFASYAGAVQHHGWVADPSTVQNVRRAAYEAFDPKLETLGDIVAKAQQKGQQARDLESAVAWLVWMMGFSVVQLGAVPRTQDFADLIATTPNGHFAVVECTTGLLKAENKLGLLLQRTEAVRRALDASNHRHLRVLPVVVTSRMKTEIAADIEQAEKLGILVLSRENLDLAISQTLVMPNADQIYDEAEQTVRTAQEKYRAEPQLPFENNG